MTTLVRSGLPDDRALDELQSQVVELEHQVSARAREISQVESTLAAFTADYRRQVGTLHEELDELERAIAEAELGERAKHAAADASRPTASSQKTPVETMPQFTTDAVRKLFRDVAKAIHPDLAGHDLTTDERHVLMIEANRAYAVGDEERLRWILRSWENHPDTVRGTDLESTRLRLTRRITTLEDQLTMCAGELETLKASPMWKLKTMVDEAAGRRKNLVRDMVGRLKRDIMIARNRLDAIRSIP